MAVMARLARFFAQTEEPIVAQRDSALSWPAYQEFFKYASNWYGTLQQTLPGTNGEEKVASTFVGIVQSAYKANGVVFACMLARMMLFQEARFLFREINDEGRPDKFRWHENLKPLEKPWKGGTTGDLLARAIQWVDLSGNTFIARRENRLVPLRPDWTTILAGSPREDAGVWDIDAEVFGYAYQEGGPSSGRRPIFLPVETVAHWAPIPDPVARFRGMPWTATVITDVEADNAATIHKRQFFANGATPNMIVHFDPEIVKDLATFNAYVDAIEENHAGALNAYKTMYLTGATSAEVVGTNLQQLDFKATQGAGETRICAAAGVPAVIVGISEGLQGSSLNAGNYSAAFRRFADLFARPHWRNFAGSLETIIPPPGSNSPVRRSQLWYDDRDIPALRQDELDRAQIQAQQAAAMRQLIDAGYEPNSVTDAVARGELSLLKHTGKPTVQVQNTKPAVSGNGNRPASDEDEEEADALVDRRA